MDLFDVLLLTAPVVIIGIASFRLLRYMPWSEEWRPPSSRLTLLGLGSTLLLLGRAITDGWDLLTVFFIVVSNACMFHSYRTALRSEARHREHQRRTEDLGG